MAAGTSSEATQILHEFLVESRENLDQMDRDLLALEQDPHAHDYLCSIFRAIHTIKGTCGFLGYKKLESLAHVGESLLCKMRDGALTLNAEITNALLAQVDAIRQILDCLEQAGDEGAVDYSDLQTRLTALQQPSSACVLSFDESSDNDSRIGHILVEDHVVTEAAVKAALHAQIDGEPKYLGEILVERKEVQPEQLQNALKTQQEMRLAEGSIRVDVSLLDKLMNQVGELVLARNQILQYTSTLHDPTFLSTSQRLNIITTELQEGVMKTRMQPIGNIWSKFPRVVRDISQHCGKKVRVEMEGKETELDKTIVEAIKDPLTHIIRNSVDHGIEHPDHRIAQGKPEEGCLQLRAYHEGGQVNIEISDDGAGLNLERIRQKGIERGLITTEQASRMTDREISLLIFAPGFSTAAAVTNISGRGVGMDVVKTNVEKIGGSVDIQSQPGRGTTIKLKIPLTLAIIPALVVTCAGDRYAIPQISLLELVRLEGEAARVGIERLHGAPVYRLRGQLLPIVYLHEQLGIQKPEPSQEPGAMEEVVNIVVLRADDKQFGLVVDSINDTEEIVVKPLSKQLKGIPIYAGATIMGDGRVALILDVLGTAQHAHVVSGGRDRNLTTQNTNHSTATGPKQSLLILAVGDHRVAIPISMVSRLEEIPAAQIEKADRHEVIQYRGDILPIVRLAEVLNIVPQEAPEKPLQLVVFSEEGRSVGLLVDRIADIVTADVQVQRKSTNPALLASAVIQDRVTDLLNLPMIIRRLDETQFEASLSM